jgi:hypothetical protein
MSHPRRKLDPLAVRQIRTDYRARRKAERDIARARAVLSVVPTCCDHARAYGVTQNIVLSAAQGLTYRDIE